MKYGKPTPTQSTPGLSENDKVLQLAQAIINLTKDNRTTDEPLTAFPDGQVLHPTKEIRQLKFGAKSTGGEIDIQLEPRLQQKWIDADTGEAIWKDIPIVIEEAPETPSPLSSPSEEIKTPSSTTPDPANGIVEGEA